ncbi:MAG: hypothetical protein QM486_04680 [Flavobacteriaceae bacterium]
MTKQLTYIFFVFLFYQSQAQVLRHAIVGRIKNDSLSVEGIHVLNKNTKKRTISNQYGVFNIPVTINDTLIFEGIQFKKKELVITKRMVKTKSVDVTLIQNINELATVEIKNHNLTGDLVNDAKKVKKPISQVSKGALDFSHINFNVVDDIDATDREGPANVSKLTNPNIPGGVSLMFLVRPILKGISKIGERKRKLKTAKKAYKKEAETVPDKIRRELGDAFFEEQLKIPKDQIDVFINYCRSKGVVDLYMAGKKIEMIQLLVDESKNFKAYIKTQK